MLSVQETKTGLVAADHECGISEIQVTHLHTLPFDMGDEDMRFPLVCSVTCKAFLVYSPILANHRVITMKASAGSLSMRTGAYLYDFLESNTLLCWL